MRSQPRSGRSISSNWITVSRATGRRQGPGLRLGLDNLQEPALVSAALRSHAAKMSQSVHSRSVLTWVSGHFSIISVSPPSAICLPVITSSGEVLHCKCCNKQDSARLNSFPGSPALCGSRAGRWTLHTRFIFRYLPFVDLDISKEILRTSQLVCR